MDREDVAEEHSVASISIDYQETCWGCGLRLLPSYGHIIKCRWCGAIINYNQTSRKPDSACFSRWRLLRDRFFVVVIILFILFVICAGVWAVYPTIFSSYFCGIFHTTMIAILAIFTISSFCLAAFRSPGVPLSIPWGSYSVVAKDGLENYTFCVFCSKPKPATAHHCRSCKMCVLDMDHHCPFIGNCVGAANRRAFIAFLISIVVSCIYLVVITTFAAYHVWPSTVYRSIALLGSNNASSLGVLEQILAVFASSVPARGFVLVYLAFAGISVEIGIIVLLWQQLKYVYEGNTYLNRMSSAGHMHGDRGCHNLLRFFGCQYSTFRFVLGPANTAKLTESESSKLI